MAGTTNSDVAERWDIFVLALEGPAEGNCYLIENVPAYICRQCGEITLAESTAARIQQLI